MDIFAKPLRSTPNKGEIILDLVRKIQYKENKANEGGKESGTAKHRFNLPKFRNKNNSMAP